MQIKPYTGRSINLTQEDLLVIIIDVALRMVLIRSIILMILILFSLYPFFKNVILVREFVHEFFSHEKLVVLRHEWPVLYFQTP